MFLGLPDTHKAAKWRGSWKPRGVTLTVGSNIMKGRMQSNQALETYCVSWRTNVVSANTLGSDENRVKQIGPSFRRVSQDFPGFPRLLGVLL